MGKETKTSIIVSAGDMKKNQFNDIDISKDDFIIACDGGYDHCLKYGILPDILIGDFDSVKAKFPQNIEKIALNCEKDDTDTISAIKLALERGYKNIILLGSLGGRIDHAFANLEALNFINKNGASGEIIGDCEQIKLIANDNVTINPNVNMTLSIFTPDEKALGVTLKNVKYELDNYTMTNDFPIGVSNEFTEKPAFIEVKKGRLLIMLTAKNYEYKK